MGSIVFCLGGIKSGKTGFAQARARELDKAGKGPVLYLATAQALDAEMKRRIYLHRSSRPSHWKTVEEPLAPHSVIEEAGAGKIAPGPFGVVILDCLTLLMTNILIGRENEDSAVSEKAVLDEVGRIVAAGRVFSGVLFIISNDVGGGLVSPYPMGRLFQDVAGMAHQAVARAADEVFFLRAGLPQKLK
jgi:adenosylcobinamide kinase / adenosylcobinamide-phosphate guanylyltransferase